MNNNFNLKSFLVEGKLLKEELDLSSWEVLEGPGGYIFQIQGSNGGVIDARVNKEGMVTLDGEGEEAVQAIKQIATKLGINTKTMYSDNSLTTIIPESDFNIIFPNTAN